MPIKFKGPACWFVCHSQNKNLKSPRSPGLCDSVVGVSLCAPKGYRFHSRARAHAWVAGSIPRGRGACGGGQPMDISVSLSSPRPPTSHSSEKQWEKISLGEERRTNQGTRSPRRQPHRCTSRRFSGKRPVCTSLCARLGAGP